LPRCEEWPGEDKTLYDWVNVLDDKKEYAVGYKHVISGLEFFIYHY
jgi:hypothetical protein